MSNKLQLKRRIRRLLSGEDNFTITDIAIHRDRPAPGKPSFWGTLRRGRIADPNATDVQNSAPREDTGKVRDKDEISLNEIKKYSNHEQDSTPQKDR